MKITLCSSARFFERLYPIKDSLEKRGYDVLLPSMKDYHMEGHLAKMQHNLIRDHFNKIEKSNAIYIANYKKHGIEGYIGGNCFLEMGKAFDKGIPIFLREKVPKVRYQEEIIAMGPLIIGENWDTLDRILKY